MMLVEKGIWDEFEEWAFIKWDSMKPFKDLSRSLGNYADWFFNPKSCQLVADWWREEHHGQVAGS